MSSKTQVYGSPGIPPGPPKVIPRPRWEQAAVLIEGTRIRRPARSGDSRWGKPGRMEIGGRYKTLATGEERDCLLEADEAALGRAEELFSLFLLTGGDAAAVEGRLRVIKQNVSDDVSRAFVAEVEQALTLLLGMPGEGVING